LFLDDIADDRRDGEPGSAPALDVGIRRGEGDVSRLPLLPACHAQAHFDPRFESRGAVPGYDGEGDAAASSGIELEHASSATVRTLGAGIE
jgi:hypothetical protein